MPLYRIGLPSAECVGEVRVQSEAGFTISYSTVQHLSQSEVLAVPEPSLALSLIAGGLALALIRRVG